MSDVTAWISVMDDAGRRAEAAVLLDGVLHEAFCWTGFRVRGFCWTGFPCEGFRVRRFGFVGLPNAGKSTLFNALTCGSAHAAPYAFSTTDSNVGVAKVPDRRLDRLAAMSRSRRSIPASVQFTDIGGLVEGASRGDGLGKRLLGSHPQHPRHSLRAAGFR